MIMRSSYPALLIFLILCLGAGSPSSRHRSMKCSCDAERSFSSDARHLAMNSPGVMVSTARVHRDRHGVRYVHLNRQSSFVPGPVFLSCSNQDAVVSYARQGSPLRGMPETPA